MSLQWQIVVALAMLALNALFVGAEFGLVSSRRSKIELQALSGSRPAKLTLQAMEKVSLMLTAAQLGVTLCSLVFGAVAEPLSAHLLEQPFQQLGLPHQLLYPIAFGIGLAVITYIHVVIGEMVPKNIALAKPTGTALALTPILLLFVRLMLPLVHALNMIANAVVRLIGLQPKPEIASSFSRDEVAGFVKESHKEGLLSQDEEQLLSGALSFDEKAVRHVLIPLNKLVTVTPRTTASAIETLSAKTGFSRFPVVSKGELTGYIHIKDLLDITPTEQAKSVSLKLVRELPEIRPHTSLRRALVTMQQLGAHLAEVVTARGETLGVVALEDVLEELVGDIRDDARLKQETKA